MRNNFQLELRSSAIRCRLRIPAANLELFLKTPAGIRRRERKSNLKNGCRCGIIRREETVTAEAAAGSDIFAPTEAIFDENS